MAGGSVDFDVAAQRAYDFLVDPVARPRWQSSLRAVEVCDGWEPGDRVEEGLRWVDVTWPGLRPRMELTVADRPDRWTEIGHWGVFSAELTLEFASTSSTSCVVTADFEVRARGVLTPLGRVVTAMGVRPVLADLGRAARLLQ